MQRLVARLTRGRFLIESIVSGDTKYMGVCRLNDAGFLLWAIDAESEPFDLPLFLGLHS